jgi:hypothetical protein
MGGRDPPERLVVINWNDWSRSIGIAGRHQPVRAPGDDHVQSCTISARNELERGSRFSVS